MNTAYRHPAITAYFDDAGWRPPDYRTPRHAGGLHTQRQNSAARCLLLRLQAAMLMPLWAATNKGVTIYKSPCTSNTRSTIARASLPWTLTPLAAHAKA